MSFITGNRDGVMECIFYGGTFNYTVGLDLFTPSALALHPRELRSFHPENNLIL